MEGTYDGVLQVGQTRHSGPTSVFICPRSNIDFYMPAASNINYRDYIERNL